MAFLKLNLHGFSNQKCIVPRTKKSDQFIKKSFQLLTFLPLV